MRHQGIYYCSYFALLGVLMLLPVSTQARETDCTSLVVGRSYSQGFMGLLRPGFWAEGLPDELFPNAGAGRVTFLPGGRAKASITIATGGVGLFRNVPLEGSYELFRDYGKTPVVCSGTLTLSGVFPEPSGQKTLHSQVVVGNNAKRIEMMLTDTGLMVAFAALPMQSFGCSNASVDGKYSASANVWWLSYPTTLMPPNVGGYLPVADSVVMQFHPYQRSSDGPSGSSTIEGWDTTSFGGTASRTLTGWYKVNSDCTGTIELAVTSDYYYPFQHLEMFVLNNGTIQVLNVDTVPYGSMPTHLPTYLFMLTLNRVTKP